MAISSTGLSTKGLRSEFFDALNKIDTQWQDVCTIVKSNSASEEYRWLGSSPQMREWISGRVAKGLSTESYSVENLKYEVTIEVDRDEISDDQTGQIVSRVRSLASVAANHKWKLVGQLLENGSTALFESYDKTEFFASDHVRGLATGMTNEINYDISALAALEGPDDITSPTTKQFQQAFSAGVAQYGTFKTHENEPMGIDPTGLVVIVPHSMRLPALSAFGPSIAALHGGAVPNEAAGMARVLVNPYLTDLSKFFILKTDGHVRPFIFQDREPIEFVALEANSDIGFQQEKYQYGVRARYRLTYGEPLFAISVDLIT